MTVVIHHESGARQEEQTRAVAGSQAWYWSPDWQQGEREADADLTAGRSVTFNSEADFERHLASLPTATQPVRPGEDCRLGGPMTRSGS